jgi:sodium-dependent dicarboxylate transporter 2/3/5
MLVPVVVAIAQATAVRPVPPALGAAMARALASCFPSPRCPNAIVYSSGPVPLREMVRAGALLDVAGAAVMWLSLRLLCPLLGVM